MADEQIFGGLAKAVVEGDVDAAAEWAQKAVKAAIDPLKAMDALIKGLREVGDGFQRNEVFLPELILASEAMKAAATILESELLKKGVKREVVATAVLGTVAGDLHDIGKSIVGCILSAHSFKVIDLGTDVTPEKFVNAVKEHNPGILGMSALLTTTMPVMQEVVQKLAEAGVRDKVIVIVGGAPVTQDFANSIGADLYGIDAVDGVNKLRGRLGVK